MRFAGTINLPGTTETNRKGRENPERWAGGLTRLDRFNRLAWYEREITLPEAWRDQRRQLLNFPDPEQLLSTQQSLGKIAIMALERGCHRPVVRPQHFDAALQSLDRFVPLLALHASRTIHQEIEIHRRPSARRLLLSPDLQQRIRGLIVPR